MKNKKYILAIGCALTMGLTSCSDWLDVNVDEDNPNNKSVLVENRVPWIQRMYMYSKGVTDYRTSAIAGALYSTNGNVNTAAVTWNFANGLTTTSYQTFFVETASNLQDLYDKAKEEGAYHYMAVSDVYHAMGFMDMLDLYGEIPYTNALGSSPVPTYDDGKTIFNGCIAKLDEAIELFGQTQANGATPLSSGDMLLGGDANKWIKLCYALKARYLLRLSKKSDLFDPTTILSCLDKAMQSNDDNALLPCYNDGADVTDYLFGDPVMTNGHWDCIAYGATQRTSKYYYDLLTNMRGAGVEDPRFTKIVPAAMSNITLGTDGKVASYKWQRSLPVDAHGDCERLQAGGAASIVAPTWASSTVKKAYKISDDAKREAFAEGMRKIHEVTINEDTVKVTYPKGSVYVNSDNYILAGDTVYVSLRNNSMLTGNSSRGDKDMYWYFQSSAAMTANAVGSTGSFQVRPNSDFEIMTYAECCFIKAEVEFRQNNKTEALSAYKKGIQANIDMMQDKLTEWKSAGYENPDMWPMDEGKITAYMASDAVCQNASELTMQDIMLQKYVALGFSIENWNDMRRFNYSAGNIGDFGVVYPNFDRSVMFTGTDKLKGTSKTDPQYWPRRYRLPATLELSYNETNALIANSHAEDTDIWSYPVWWDCASDSEYESYR